MYKVTVTLENGSGRTISIGMAYVDHFPACSDYCNPATEKASFMSRTLKDDSSDSETYYTCVASGKELPEPNWRLDFKFLD